MRKQMMAFAMTFTIIVSSFSVFADESDDPMAVTLISGPEDDEAESVSLDDIKVGKEIEIEGFGNLTFTGTENLDEAIINDTWKSSGEEADYVALYFDILNTKTKDKDYLANVEVKAIYDDVYEYAGWYYQIDYDRDSKYWIAHENDKAFSISPMYTGHYVIGATLPNAVVNGNKELRFEIKIDGNEMTYYFKK